MACNKNVQELDSEKAAKAGDTMTGVLAFIAGTASAPGIAASGDTDTGIFFPAADTIGFSTGGSERGRFDSSGLKVSGAARLEAGTDFALQLRNVGVENVKAKWVGTSLVWYNTNDSGALDDDAILTFHPGNGAVTINGTTDDGNNKLQVSGNGIRISTSQTPATAGATGTTGTFAWDTTYFYICTATNTWQRVQHATW